MKPHECPATKTCSKCLEVKPLSEFYYHKKRKHYDARCKSCAKEQVKARAQVKAREIAEYQKQYRETNKDKLAEQKRDWYMATRPRQLELRRMNYRDNKAKYIYRARKRDRQIALVTPSWFDAKKAEEVYEEAERLSKETGIPHEVDHIVPLFGRTVRGLHVHTNLRAIPITENRRKHCTMVEDIVWTAPKGVEAGD